MARKFIITGGPCTGKTSVIDELGKEFKVFHEVARKVLQEEEYNKRVQYEIFKKQVEQSREGDLEKVVFFDRGIPDSLAYFRYHCFEIPENVSKRSQRKKTNYEIVFFLEPVPYEKDDVRYEDEEEGKKIHKVIGDVYRELGYRVVDVPLMSVKERAEFVKGFLR